MGRELHSVAVDGIKDFPKGSVLRVGTSLSNGLGCGCGRDLCVLLKEGEVSYILWTEAKYHFVKHQKSVFSSFFK